MFPVVHEATWAALADPNRRAVLGLLRERPRGVGELVGALQLTQPATSKHLRVLREAGLVRVVPEAQRRIYALDPAPLAELDAWLDPYREFWNDRLDALGRHLDETEERACRTSGPTWSSTAGRRCASTGPFPTRSTGSGGRSPSRRNWCAGSRRRCGWSRAWVGR